MTVLVLATLAGACVPASLRWLRVAQREHYHAGSVSRFARRWWSATPLGLLLAGAGFVGTVVTGWWEPAGVAVAAVVAVGPPGLGMRGRTSSLAWTARLRRLAAAVAVVVVGAVAVGWVVGPVVTAGVAMLLPVGFDLVLALLAPLERRLGEPWVRRAAAALESSGVTVVAITGSYGKTSTKGHVAHLLSGVRSTLASPASFNNRMGLARAVNEHLAPATDVFVAEMGIYGPGEIAELCSWIPPDVSVITAIGPVHLERMGSLDAIVEAKREIMTGDAVGVLNVDDPRLASVADEEEARRVVIRAATGGAADVVVEDGHVRVGDETMGRIPDGVHPGNVACAMGVVLALGIDPSLVAPRLEGLREPEHRRTIATGSTGVLIVDDTFNANPSGARAALDQLVRLDVTGRRVVVTPGMVELGARQTDENRAFAAEAAAAADHIVVVGRTNRNALLAGAGDGPATLTVLDNREEAVEWVRSNLGAGDAVLYENDLPDHYP